MLMSCKLRNTNRASIGSDPRGEAIFAKYAGGKSIEVPYLSADARNNSPRQNLDPRLASNPSASTRWLLLAWFCVPGLWTLYRPLR
jgi:hypothetical protein